VAQGLGIRYTESGSRALGLERTDNGYRVTGIAAGPSGESPVSFLSKNGFTADDTVVACGLCAGDFLTATVPREDGFDNDEMNDQLTWEIERKLLSDPSAFSIDYVISDNGFAFAGRYNLIASLKGSLDRFVTDVEPVAMYNGCETAGETGNDSVLLLSIEAEGVSSVLVSGGMLVAIESFPVRNDTLTGILPGLDRERMESVETPVIERLADYSAQSVARLSAIAERDKVKAPDRIVVAGGGAYLGEITGMIQNKTGLGTAKSEPFASLPDDVREMNPELTRMSAAFTTCFGLAVRALEEL